MNEGRKQILRQLLTEALKGIVIKSGDGSRTLPIPSYRNELLISRQVYRPNSAYVELLFHPDLQNGEIKSKLLDFMRKELTVFINKDKILPISYFIIGGILSGFPWGCPLDDLLKQLLKIAILQGVKGAVLAFDQSTKDTSFSFQEINLLEGIKLNTEMHVSDGIRLVPVPNSESELPPYLDYTLSLRSLKTNSFLGKTLLIIDYSVSPIFNKPVTNPDDFSDNLQIKRSHNDSFPSNEEFKKEFCHALSLACNSAVQVAFRWNFLEKDVLFNLSNSRTGLTAGFPRVIGNRSIVNVDETHIDEAKHLYKNLDNFDSETLEKLQIAIDRWIKSKTSQSAVDKMIDLGIAFETLYLSGRKNLARKFRRRASWFLKRDEAHRKALKEKFEMIYELRCDAVHEGKLPRDIEISGKSIPVSKFIEKAQGLCQRSILKVIKNRQFPDWAQIHIPDCR